MYNSAAYKVEEVGRFPAHPGAPERAFGRAGGLHHRRHQDGERHPHRRHHHPGCQPRAQPLARIQGGKARGLFLHLPISSDDYQDLADALEKYKLNDAALVYQKDASAALGQGFRCGFLGLLHLEIVQERLEREFDLSIIMTVPGGALPVHPGRTAHELTVDNPLHYPDPSQHQEVERAFHQGRHPHPGALSWAR